MNTILLTYMAVAVLFETIYIAANRKKYLANPKVKAIQSVVNSQKQLLVIKNALFSWYGIPLVVIPLTILVFQFKFPFTIRREVHKLIYKKSEEEKKSQDVLEKYGQYLKQNEERTIRANFKPDLSNVMVPPDIEQMVPPQTDEMSPPEIDEENHY